MTNPEPARSIVPVVSLLEDIDLAKTSLLEDRKRVRGTYDIKIHHLEESLKDMKRQREYKNEQLGTLAEIKLDFQLKNKYLPKLIEQIEQNGGELDVESSNKLLIEAGYLPSPEENKNSTVFQESVRGLIRELSQKFPSVNERLKALVTDTFTAFYR